MDNDSRILDNLFFTSDIESETIIKTENTINSFIATQNNIESFENIDSNDWSSQVKLMVPYCFKSAPGIKVKIPKPLKVFIELFFTEKLINFIHKLTIKKQHKKSKKKQNPFNTNNRAKIKNFSLNHMQLGIKNVSNFAHCWRKSKKFVYNSLIAGLMSLERFAEINKMITMISKKDIVSKNLKGI
ncbi:hypothetical protein CDIK_0931 [Cucumispora dikerogammari]|nr:hypothetical protein CDIK_0931 [Cucumispora dikerogammari]